MSLSRDEINGDEIPPFRRWYNARDIRTVQGHHLILTSLTFFSLHTHICVVREKKNNNMRIEPLELHEMSSKCLFIFFSIYSFFLSIIIVERKRKNWPNKFFENRDEGCCIELRVQQ